MDTASWGNEFSEARQRLVECDDYAVLSEAAHELKDGTVLTSMSDVPFEMSFKCARCAEVFWFENFAWETGDLAQWRLLGESRTRAVAGCVMQHVADGIGRERRLGIQP